MAVKMFLLFAACVALCVAQPIDYTGKLPVLDRFFSPKEVTFRTSASSEQAHPFVIPCATVITNDKVTYSWTKDGKPFDLKSRQDIKQRAGEGSLVFSSPKDSDAGLYQCFAKSEEGVASSRVISVKKTYVEIPKYTLQKHKPEEGKPFKLECSVTKAYPKPVIEWYRQGKDSSKLIDIKEKRLLESPEGDLYFTNVTREDVDKDLKYVCTVATQAADAKLIAAEHIIEDLTPAKEPKNAELTPQYLSKDMTVKTGDIAVMMYCIYGGTPMAHPDWFKISRDGTRTNVNGKPGDRVTHRNRSAGRRLWITKVQADDDATYECVANNGEGKPQSHKIKLTVDQAVEFEKDFEPIIEVKEGQDVTIPCPLRGADTVAWTFNGKPYEGKTSKNSLTLTKVQKKDNGYYGCSGSNKLGSAYNETLLHVH